ncbi:MAG: SHOCT domain-containing protein [Ilumatobacteraceae bacterium]
MVTVARSANQPAHPGPDTTPPRDPEQILRERFAQGEIDETEYEHRRQVLRR